MEGRIKAIQEKQRELSAAALVGGYKATSTGELLFANNAMAEIFEVGSPEEMVSTKMSSWCKNAADGQRMQEAIANGETIDGMEIETLTRGGRLKRLLVTAMPAMGIIQGTIKDITELRQLDHKLLQSQKLESLGTLAGGIAHDFNNILGIIQGHLMILEKYSYDEERCARSLKTIQYATERGATLARQILAFARERSVTYADVRVNDVITELAKLLLETFPRSITITATLEGDQPIIAGDPNLIHQMLFNLCINARDAMPQGGVLSIASSTVDGKSCFTSFPKATTGNYVCVAVSDSGVGIGEGAMQRIFEPFFTTKSPDKGTGLGLSIVQSIVESHRGFIDVRSSIGAGTTFSVFLPAIEQVEERPGNGEGERGFAGGIETILFVEDEPRIRDLMQAFLESNGYSVLSAKDGEEGLLMYKEHRKEIDLIISDLGLPRLNGADMLQKIRAADPDVRVIVASGYIDPDMRTRILHMGIQHLITKPYLPDIVMQKVRQVLDGDG